MSEYGSIFIGEGDHEDGFFVIDHTLPPNTMRFMGPAGPIDFDVIEDADNGIRLERRHD